MSLRTKMRIGLSTFLVVLIGLTYYSSAHAAPPPGSLTGSSETMPPAGSLTGSTVRVAANSAFAPIQLHFVQAPRAFDWNINLTYTVKLTSASNQSTTTYLTFMPYVQLMPGAQGTNGKGGVNFYNRRYVVQPGKFKVFSFRLRTLGPIDNDVYWCLQVYMTAEGQGPQSISTCALPHSK